MTASNTRALATLPLLEPLETELQAVLNKMRRAAIVEVELLDEALAHVVAVGGKLIRPALAISSACIYRQPDDKVISLAASVEMLHTATLVHDDMIDDAARRRGNPTLHTLLNPTSAVLLGDYLFAQAAAWAAETDSIRVVRIFSETLMTIVQGELRQMWAQFDLERAAEDYQARIYGKTAALFAAACEAGGVLGGAPEEEIQALREYGRLFGLAFQIVDDVLDYVGDAAQMGKPVGGDLRQGNITLPAILYLRDYDDDNLAERYFEDRHLTSAEVDEVVSRVVGSPALQDSLTTAQRLIEDAKRELTKLPPSPHLERLRELGDYIVRRNI
ncbi:MAG: polyprenyl synthetase family protein [Chloroflexota bacterium]|nr:polyprenyl synthetase family protein [Chloroflexota bacterium]